MVRQHGERREAGLARWGLVPFWANDPAIGHRLVNARAETAATKPAFRAAFRHRRALMPADLFYEWQALPGHKTRQPWCIRLPDAEPFAMAALWEQWTPKEAPDAQPLVTCCMDFNFIGGSLGSVMGEKIARAADHCRARKVPLMIISKSGGARMMESAFSLMQLPKTLGKLALLADAGVPYISLCTDPTYGGTTASFAMMGDVNLGEPGALIGFAGPRVIRETIKKDLPEGFQSSEFVLEHGFLDRIVPRKELRDTIATLLTHFRN
ncbi:MAG: hypothetical protein EBZ67_04900 [Chitinophagia bacterium]|nr:hypothetical protein [Chitinophagia bacterium]